MRKKLCILLGISIVAALYPSFMLAHCPLCTLGAGAVAAGAAWLGVNSAAIGVFLGTFGMALGLWMSRAIKKHYFAYQSWLLGAVSFAITILPLRPLLTRYSSIYFDFGGDYGSLFNHTYLIDIFLTGAIVGAAILALAPLLSKYLTIMRRGKMIGYQGIIITFSLLILASAIFQVLL